MTELILNAAMKGTIVLALAWAATALLHRRSADLRHAVWLAALLGMALLLIPASMPEGVRITVLAGASPDVAARTAARSLPWLAILWGAGAAIVAMRFAVGVIHLARLTRSARRRGDVHVSNAVSSPMTWGVLRPVVLLPAYAEQWPAAERDLAMQHERAHIERRDWLWQSFAQLLTAVFWFHPLVWFAAARLRAEAEQAADDAVLASGAAAPDYAAQLLSVAKQVRAASPVAAVAMVRKPVLTERVTAILDSTRARARATVRSRIAIALVCACLVPVLAAFQAPALAAFQAKEPLRIGGGVTAPMPTYQTEPDYTEEARDAKIEGSVLLTIVVDEFGFPTDIQVVRSLDPGLDAEAVKAVKQWRFKPATKDKVPVPVRATMEVKFKLI